MRIMLKFTRPKKSFYDLDHLDHNTITFDLNFEPVIAHQQCAEINHISQERA